MDPAPKPNLPEKAIPARMEISHTYQHFKPLAERGEIEVEGLDALYKEGKITLEERNSLSYFLAKKLQQVAITDPLTGLLNTRTLEPKINKLIPRLKEHQSVLIVTMDLNGLSFFNDKYDHAKGSEAIVTFANRLKKVLRREGDAAFRIGGDEFALVFHVDSNDDSPENLYKRIQKEITKELSITGEDGKLDLLVRANFGHVIAKKGETRTAKELLAVADEEERQKKPNKKLRTE